MRLVSQVSRDIMQLDQLQRSQVLVDQETPYNSFEKESGLIALSLDSLSRIYRHEDRQVSRLDSIKTLLSERDKLFRSYIKVRERLIDSQEFSEQLQSIGDLIQDTSQIGSTVVTTTKRTRDVKIEPGSQNRELPTIDDRSFFGRLFGGRKRDTLSDNAALQAPRRTVIEELEVLVDTITTSRQDSALALIDSVLMEMEERQRMQSSSFISHEIDLTIAGNVLVSNMLSILSDVENEAMLQMEREHDGARSLMNGSIDRINILVISFFLITAILVLLILSDIRKSNRYRLQLEIAKEEAEYHSAAKQRFLSNMSHELRTPLQSIIGYAEQLSESEEKDRAEIDIIYRSSEHLLQIVNEVLDYNRINSGKFKFNNTDFNLNNLVREVLAAMQLQADQKQLDLQYAINFEGTEWVKGDPFRVKQILYNILSNAIKFTSRGFVSLSTYAIVENDTVQVRFTVEDSGKGIHEKDIARIFNEFEQAENANSGEHFGSGLGLSIVKTLCEAMNGTIEIESEIERGSTFRIFIPLEKSDQVSVQSSAPAELIPLEAFNDVIWVVDDDQFILELCRNIFNKYNIRHRCFSSPEALLATPIDDDVSIMLMDMRMPGKTGSELNQEVREKLKRKITIYAFTAQALPEERDKILAMGFDGLLLKPFREQQLLQLIGLVSQPAKHSTPVDIDFSSLTRLVFGDQEQLLKVIALYQTDTRQDLRELRKAYAEGDYDQVALLVHKLAGRTAQIGAKELAEELRKLELVIRKGNTRIEGELRTVIKGLTDLIESLEKYRREQVEMTQ